MILKSLIKYVTLFITGMLIYFEFELNWRYFAGTLPVHWTMPVLGGVLFVIIGGINNWFTWKMSLLKQGIIGAVAVTLFEFTVGCIVNLWLGLNVWDYSHLPFNVLGQICLPFSLLWIAVAILAVIIDDYIRYWFFDEEKPHYKII